MDKEKTLADRALTECVYELRGACRKPVDQSALDEFLDRLRPQFESILNHPDGTKRWIEAGRPMRNNGRYVGALADFFAAYTGAAVVGPFELTQAFNMVRAICRVGAEGLVESPIDTGGPAERLLRALKPKAVTT